MFSVALTVAREPPKRSENSASVRAGADVRYRRFHCIVSVKRGGDYCPFYGLERCPFSEVFCTAFKEIFPDRRKCPSYRKCPSLGGVR